MTVDASEFRRLLGHWATGVAVVATRKADGTPCGLTANAVASVSLRPPLVLACVEHDADTHDCIAASGLFAVSILAGDQERLARRFAAWDITDKFAGIAYREAATGAPILEDALAWVDCRLWASYDGGDHTIYVGEVVEGDAAEGTPILYYRGGYGRFIPGEWRAARPPEALPGAPGGSAPRSRRSSSARRRAWRSRSARRSSSSSARAS
jgi:flavin reductase (DIM6/NTAB) family NADH-FMN oxidoreductase RutF